LGFIVRKPNTLNTETLYSEHPSTLTSR
jgi:hypothetical protein